MTAAPDRHLVDHYQNRASGGDHQNHQNGRRARPLSRHLVVAASSAGETTRTPDHQNRPGAGGPVDHQVAPTHRIVAPPTGGELVARPGGGRVSSWALELRPFRESADRIEYARNGAYSVRTDGWWRNANIVHSYVVTIPVILVCDLLKFCVGTLSRTLLTLLIVPMVLMLANQIPLTAWAIPDAFDFTTAFTAPPEPGPVG